MIAVQGRNTPKKLQQTIVSANGEQLRFGHGQRESSIFKHKGTSQKFATVGKC